MKPLLKTLTVAALTSCLTTLHFSAALAQSDFDTTTSRKSLMKRNELATPSFLLAPQSGAVVETNYTRSQISVETKRPGTTLGVSDRQSSDIESNLFTTGGAVAINRNIFAGLRVDYGFATRTNRSATLLSTDDKVEGVKEPVFSIGGRMNSGMISGIAQVDYKVGIGDSVSSIKSGRTFESNGKEGGGAIIPSLAVFSNQKDSIILGGQLEYSIEQDKAVVLKNESTGIESRSTISGGNMLTATAFLETNQLSTAGLGIAASYSSVENSRDKTALVDDTIKGSEFATVLGYGVIRPMEQLTIQPVAGFAYYLNGKYRGYDIENQSAFIGLISARLAF